MKKQVLAMVVAVACASASAQSSVTLFGIIDAGVARMSAAGNAHSVGMASGGNSNSRLGFRGSEDLGGGLAASFWLEGQLNNDVGNGGTQTTGLDFQRRSTVSLSGNFGEVRLGRDYTPIYLNLIQYDVWGQRGLGTVETTGSSRGGVGSYARTSNGIAYFLPGTLGGFHGTFQYAFGEQQSNQKSVANAAGISTSAANAATDKTGNTYGARFGYANGPLDLAGAFNVFQNAVRTVGTSFYAADYKVANLGAAWDFGIVRPRIVYQTERIGGRGPVADFRFRTLAIGATAPIGEAGLLRAQVARHDQAGTGNDFSKYSLGYVYSLSKRTVLYADVARLKNKGTGTVGLNNMSASVASPTPIPGGASTGYMVGMKHSF